MRRGGVNPVPPNMVQSREGRRFQALSPELVDWRWAGTADNAPEFVSVPERGRPTRGPSAPVSNKGGLLEGSDSIDCAKPKPSGVVKWEVI